MVGFNVCYAGGGVFLSSVDYNVDIDYISDNSAAVLHNDVMKDNLSNLISNQTPLGIRAIRGARIDGYHQDSAGVKYFSFDTDTMVAGTVVLNNDIISCDDISCSSISSYFNGNDADIKHIKIDAFTLDPNNGDVVFSIETAANIGGFMYFPADLIRLNRTTGTYSLEFNSLIPIASIVIGAHRNIDAVSLLPDGTYIFSLASDGAFFENGSFAFFNSDVIFFNSVSNQMGLAYRPSHFANDDNQVNIVSLMGYDLAAGDIIFKNSFE